ncbi:MAG: DUF2461 domain-containing protein [Meiothermus sp.]|uniref:DUF2461 domain-containing protein n=1 Tax=Meiothermus sp. TaxID=1955249 RepID=UPI0028CBDB93|nr:DUF2461 domain-containing protein [Meiothermus sp.]MDT7919287.1 DUF2461 domain-containing protein [Meiothermus sp.]
MAAVKGTKQAYFSPELFQFLVELRYNNQREWFQANKPRYEAWVRQPFLRFIADLAPRLEKIAPDYVAGPQSLFRIHRDTRFSANKAPYKTHAGAQFRHRLGQDVHMPGFYIHLEPDNCFLGAGMWMPEPDNLRRIRAAIARQDPRWLMLRKKLKLDGEGKLTRPPKGFDPHHPLIEDLKQRSFTVSYNLSEEIVVSEELMDTVEKTFRRLLPLNRFLSEVLLLPTET